MTVAAIRRPLGSRTVTSVPGSASRASTWARQMGRPRVGDIRLEVMVEQLEARVTSQLGDIARKSEAIARLKAQLAEKNAVSDALGAKLRSFSVENQDAGQDYDMQSAAAAANTQALADKDSELAMAALEASELI